MTLNCFKMAKMRREAGVKRLLLQPCRWPERLSIILESNSWDIYGIISPPPTSDVSDGAFFIMERDINKAFQSNALNRSLSFFSLLFLNSFFL